MKRSIMMVATSCLCAGVSQAQLTNPSFEVPGSTTVFDAWEQFENAFPDFAIARTGTVGVKLFGNGNGAFNAAGVFQEKVASAGDAWEASAWVRNDSSDPIQADNFAAINIEWRDAAGALISFDTMQVANASTPTNAWTEHTLTAVAPVNTAKARIVLIHLQGAALAPGAVFFDDANLQQTTISGLANPGFELLGPGGPVPFQFWNAFGNTFSDATFVRSGGQACKSFGNFTGGENASGVFQSFPTMPGETWEAKAWVGTPSGDRISGGNFAAVNIEWRDALNNLISFDTLVAADAATPPDQWFERTLTATAPAGAAFARVVLIHIQPAFAGGAVWWDDASFQTVVGCDSTDFNGDGIFPDNQDIIDFIEVFAGAPCPTEPTFMCNDLDFNNDGIFPDNGDLIKFIEVFAGGSC
jgi:hypothetical protein